MWTRKISDSPRLAFWFVIALLATICVPVVLTVSSVRDSALRPLAEVVKDNPTPHGYTISLLIFVVPIVLIAFWFVPQEEVRIGKRAFWWTMGILFPIGAALDFFFARYFLNFPDPGATIGLLAPAMGRWVPIEEYVFYFTGFLAVLLMYLWLDGYWLHAYSTSESDARRVSFSRLIGFHPESAILAALLIGGAVLYRRIADRTEPGFPAYFTFLVVCTFLPSMILLPKVKAVINWRALSMTVLVIALTSLVWEATLAMPYGWWGYQHTGMTGIYVRAWGGLPIEAVLVWLSVTYTTVIVYETVKCWQASGRSAKAAFLGSGAGKG